MKKKILIVDTEAYMRRFTKSILERFDYEIILVASAEEAITYLEKNVPDLILSKFVLPNMFGDEFCKLVKSNDKLKHIPFILYSPIVDNIFEVAKRVGADDSMKQPIAPEKLLAKIKNLIG
ncbi:MAG: response regulator [Dehalococcoidales bacterium]|nr:response regulator [Dehalococcoidales bacterium]